MRRTGRHYNYGELRDMVTLAEDDEGNINDDAELWKVIASGKIDINDECTGFYNVLTPILTFAIMVDQQKTAIKLLQLGANSHLSYESRKREFDTPASMAIFRDCRDVLRVLMMDVGYSAQSICRTVTRWVEDDDDEDEGWKEESYSMLQYALEHGTYETLRFILACKHIPTEFLEHHRDKLRKFDPCVSILNDAIDANRKLEAAWCTTWLTYSVMRGPWRHLCPMIVESMLNVAPKEHDEKEPASKKIKN